MCLRKVCARALALLLFGLLAGPVRSGQQPSLLEQARAEAAAGRYAHAGELYSQVLESQPDRPEALAGLADALEATGKWKEAVPLLVRLVELQPNNAARLFQLGRMKSWQPGGRAQALQLLNRATLLQPDHLDYQVGYAEVLSWSAGQRAQALDILRSALARDPARPDARRLLARILAGQNQSDAARAALQPLLQRPNPEAEDFWALGQVEEIAGNLPAAILAYRQALGRNPEHLPSLARLAEILSWKEETRPEAVRLFQRGLQVDPTNEAVLIPYSEMLSWSPGTRPQAMHFLDQVLQDDPTNARALADQAQLLAWSGQSRQALALYERALAADPNNVVALRGKAEILNWKGEHAQALDLLSRVREQSADDSLTLLDLAEANYGLRHYVEAREELAQAQGVTGPDADQLRRDVSHALGTYTELGYRLRRNRRRLDYHRLVAGVSTPLGLSNRISFFYQPTLYQTMQRDFNSNSYAVALDSQLSEKAATHFEFAGETYPGASPQVEGAFNLRYRARPSLEFTAGFAREPAEETLLSTRGEGVNGLFLGQVRSNLASLGASYSSREHNYDLSLTYTDGAYTGRHLDANRRWGIDLNLGKSVHSSRPYLRVAYGLSYLSFDHDADFQPGEAPAAITGGYFSPTRYFLNTAGFFVSQPLGRRVKWDAGGTLGVQNVETTFSSLSSPQFASSFSTHLLGDLGPQDQLRIGYEFLNVYNAFRRNLLEITWRHYY